MTVRLYIFRLMIALTTFALGMSIFSIWQYAQTKTPPQPPLVLSELPKITQPNAICPLEKEKALKEESKTAVEDATPEFNAEGDYYMIGKLPKGFKDFDFLSVATNTYREKADGSYEIFPIPPNGFLKTGKEFTFSRINIGSNQQISFTTKEIKGISYQFKGKFLGEKYYNIGDETVILEGRLIKMQDGKQIAESDVKFGDMGCGC